MKALVCGRGKSLKHFNVLEEDQYDFVYLVNDFNIFIRERPKLLRFLQNKSIKAKIIQQVNICIAGVDNFLLNNLPISECFVSRCAHIPNSDHWVDDWADTQKFLRMGIPCPVKPHPPEVRPYIVNLDISNSLPFTIINAIVEKNCLEVDVIGQDFYEVNYAYGATEPDWEKNHSVPVQERLKKGIDRVCKEFSNTKFRIFTCSTYKSKTENCKVVYL